MQNISSMLGWASLPEELLILIIRKLKFQDCIRFSRVCRAWNLSIKERARLQKLQFPLLLLPGDDNKGAKLLCFSEKRIYNVPQPHPNINDCICIGSSHGWLITVSESLQMHLINPITGVQAQLPSFTTVPHIKTLVTPDCASFFLHKAILSAAPSRDGTGDFAVILLINPYSTTRSLPYSWPAVARVGDNSRTSPPRPRGIVDIIPHKDRLYSLHLNGIVHTWDKLNFSAGPETTLTAPQLLGIEKYLVESIAGELFVLIRKRSNDRCTNMFETMRLDEKKREFVPVNDLKDSVFFVGNNCSVAVSATDFPELGKNYIYFTDDVHYRLLNYSSLLGDTGAFDIKDKTIKPIDTLGSNLNGHPPLWVTPALF